MCRISFSETDRILAERALLSSAAARVVGHERFLSTCNFFFHPAATSVYYVCMPLNEIRNIYDHLNGSKMARAMTIVIVMTAILGGCVQTYTLILKQRFHQTRLKKQSTASYNGFKQIVLTDTKYYFYECLYTIGLILSRLKTPPH